VTSLPIDSFVPEILALVREHRALVLTAAPGAGKTTRVPPALAADGPVIVLQPRRVAARSIARRIAGERGWTLGREVGWHVRFEQQFSPETRVLLATEGILTARLQQDPLLSGFRTVILDEFHERSIHADLGLALVRQAWLARDDLRIVVMSATIDADSVAGYLDGCPAIAVASRPHPLEIDYVPELGVAGGVARALSRTDGHVLCFLAGAAEIRRAAAEAAPIAAGHSAEVIPLHGGLSADEQDEALKEVPGRRVILATNIAETSLTVPGVRAVVDSGLHKVARYDPGRAIDSLQIERIPQDSADQRAGRAGRVSAGAVWRLWNASDRLRPRAQAEIHRIDLAAVVLAVLSWGGDPYNLAWFEAPARYSLDAAFELLRGLGAVSGSRITDMGTSMQRLPLHPRLARILLAAGGAEDVALGCAVLSERHYASAASQASSNDLQTIVENRPALPAHLTRVARQLSSLVAGRPSRIDERGFRRALFAGYPDRVARRRAPGSPKALLASGHGAYVGPESGVRDGEFLIAIDVTASQTGETSEARIRMAAIVDREWLEPTDVRLDHVFDESSASVRAVERELYGALVLSERIVPPSADAAASMLADVYVERRLGANDRQLLRRLLFAGLDVDVAGLVRAAAYGKRSLDDIQIADALSWEQRSQLERDAPARLPLPSGRSAPLEYREDGSVVASVKLQEMFGVLETPTIGARQEPVLLALLAPNGRPVQMTRDLRSFWDRTYPEVRKELRGRYPKHKWPEKPE
jgi:ATP-dependent helicase HrpB